MEIKFWILEVSTSDLELLFQNWQLQHLSHLNHHRRIWIKCWFWKNVNIVLVQCKVYKNLIISRWIYKQICIEKFLITDAPWYLGCMCIMVHYSGKCALPQSVLILCRQIQTCWMQLGHYLHKFWFQTFHVLVQMKHWSDWT